MRKVDTALEKMPQDMLDKVAEDMEDEKEKEGGDHDDDDDEEEGGSSSSEEMSE